MLGQAQCVVDKQASSSPELSHTSSHICGELIFDRIDQLSMWWSGVILILDTDTQIHSLIRLISVVEWSHPNILILILIDSL